MRNNRSSRQGNRVEREEVKSNIHKLEEQPHLSGAYIRSLVKQLTSSRIKDPMNPNDPNTIPSHQNIGEASSEGQRSVPPQHKKQVRRRLHTSRPYQERLLNMAEARREIVTALKFHRASMKKQANEQQQQQQSGAPNSALQPEEKIKSRKNYRTTYSPKEFKSSEKNPIAYPLNQPNLSSDNTCYPTFHSPCSSTPSGYSYWPGTHIGNFSENINFVLPSQTLGLNLNIQELDKSFYQNNNKPTVHSSSYNSDFVSSEGGISSNVISESENGSEGESLGLHQVMDEDEMAEIRTLGEQHEVEWNDTVNLVTSAWWLKFTKGNESVGEYGKGNCDGFHDVAEFPDWLKANGSCFEQDHVIDHYCLEDPALPCLDIEEIEGMDGEWLA